MLRFFPVVILLGLVLLGCRKRDKVPESAYDPEIVAAARALAQEANQGEEPTNVSSQPREKKKGDCDWETGGCQVGWICWDSWFCKGGFEDQCSATGDQRCHKQCAGDQDCPGSMPVCKEVPIFKGSDRGVLEKFCVSREK